MTKSSEQPKQENTYIIDSESGAEMARLIRLDLLVTQAMGGILAEQEHPSRFKRVLDVACGPGSWALEMAYTHDDAKVTGIDISQAMIEYARAQARVQGLHNVTFKVMDALKPLEFADNSFDLVNARFMVGFITKDQWPAIVQEFARVTAPGGIVRLTESDDPGLGMSNSAAYNKMGDLFARALFLAQRSFSSDGRHVGITPMLGSFMQKAGLQNVHEKATILNLSAGTEARESSYENTRASFLLLQPFFIKMGMLTKEEFDTLYAEVLTDMMSDDFRSLWYYTTVWGEKLQ